MITDKDLILVGFQDQDNLGLRYLYATAQKAGFRTKLISYSDNSDEIYNQISQVNPLVVGFSLIFQYMVPQFRDLIETLRARGIKAHFTMGGHYSSFDYTSVLNEINGLDSVVRFEGEQALVDLLFCIVNNNNWRSLDGIAYRDGEKPVSNPLRPPVDLNNLPTPYREDIVYQGDMPIASIIGSRGCPWNCSFCSIRPFYEAQGGKLRRLRDPDSVVQEMADLHFNHGVKIFLFQDDDFLATGKRADKWAQEIAKEIQKCGLVGRIAFKISCRTDEVKPEIMSTLAEVGLVHVYLGVESGDEQGLKNLNKFISPEIHYRAGQVLKEQEISFDFGFMLLEPDSTFDSIRNNINFLRDFVGDGYSVAGFCRMLPYMGTAIKTKLEEQGRLLGTPFQPDYNFLDPRLDLFYNWMLITFHHRNFAADGLVNVLRGMSFSVGLRFGEQKKYSSFERNYVRYLVSLCNGIAMNTLEDAVNWMETKSLSEINIEQGYLKDLTKKEYQEEKLLLAKIANFQNKT